MSKTLVASLTLTLLLPVLCLADTATENALPVPEAAAPATPDPVAEPQKLIPEPKEDEPASCPIREEDRGRAVSQVDMSFLPQSTLFAVKEIDLWGGGDVCEMSLCCGNEHCQPPYVQPECAGTCDLEGTQLCQPGQ